MEAGNETVYEEARQRRLPRFCNTSENADCSGVLNKHPQQRGALRHMDLAYGAGKKALHLAPDHIFILKQRELHDFQRQYDIAVLHLCRFDTAESECLQIRKHFKNVILIFYNSE